MFGSQFTKILYFKKQKCWVTKFTKRYNMLRSKKYMNFLLLFCLIVAYFSTYGQNFSQFSSEFTLMEKSLGTVKPYSSLVKGTVFIDKNERRLEFNIHFPDRQKWIIKDSIFEKFYVDSLVASIKIKNFDDMSIFTALLEVQKIDFGLSELGFTLKNTDVTENISYFEWSPPEVFAKFYKNAYTKTENNLLKAIRLIDVNGKEINATFFDNYEIIKGMAMPKLITTKYIGEEQKLFKSLQFDKISLL